MAPPAAGNYVVQCPCGRRLRLRQGQTVTCPSCGRRHRWADLLHRMDVAVHEPEDGDSEGGA